MKLLLLLLFFLILITSSKSESESEYEDGLFLARISTSSSDDVTSDVIDMIDDVIRVGRRHGFEPLRKLHSFDDVWIGRRLLDSRRRQKRGIEDEIVAEMMLSQQVQFIEKLHGFRRYRRSPIDVSRSKMPTHVWNLTPSMSIKDAWNSGFNASNVVVAVVDDGVDVEHVDLRGAFSPDVSFDFVRFGEKPMPKKSEDTQHGTQCAGLVSMEGARCGLGVGHGATLGAIRLLGQDVLNDALEGDALAFRREVIDIYSVSWGPRDDGRTAEAPADFTRDVIEDGARNGRHGRGNVFVWASGNGGANGDNCALDGYVSNEHTLSFGVIDSSGAPPDYSEGCSSVIAAVSGGDSMIQTTGLESTCSVISGSSAAAAIAAGIIALAIGANPSLTQRDIQHLVVESSNFSVIQTTVPFQTNWAGLKFQPNVGFGLLDASEMVRRAATWKNVGEQKSCLKTGLASGQIDLSACSEISRIERVILRGSIRHPRRGLVRIRVQSPSGTQSELLPLRPSDAAPDLLDWNFVSVHFWGESARGVWKLHIESREDVEFRVEMKEFKVTGI